MNEQKRLVARTGAVLGSSLVIAGLFVVTWSYDSPLWDVITSVAALLFGDADQAEWLLVAFLLGVFFGFLCLFTLDWRKRYQGVLLIAGSLFGWAILVLFGGLLKVPLEPTIIGLGLFSWVGTLLLGYFAPLPGFVTERRIVGDTTTETRLEAEAFVWATFAVMFLLGVTGVFQLFVSNRSLFFALVAVLGLITYGKFLWDFAVYEPTFTVSIIGPGQGGKTWGLVGIYDAFEDEMSKKALGEFSDVYASADQMTGGEKFTDIIQETEGFSKLGFGFMVGDRFPMKAKTETWDYEGERTVKLRDFLAEHNDLSLRLERFRSNGLFRSQESLFTRTEGEMDAERLPDGGRRSNEDREDDQIVAEPTHQDRDRRADEGTSDDAGPMDDLNRNAEVTSEVTSSEEHWADYIVDEPADQDRDRGANEGASDEFEPTDGLNRSNEGTSEATSSEDQLSDYDSERERRAWLQIAESDLAIVVLDAMTIRSERGNQSGLREARLNELRKIIKDLENLFLGPDILLVATKCDTYLPDYWNDEFDEFQVDDEEGFCIPDLLDEEDFEHLMFDEDKVADIDFTSFEEYVNQQLAGEDQGLDPIREMKGYADWPIHPVMFKTEMRDSDLVPVVENGSGPPEHLGFQRVVRRIREEAKKNVFL